MKRITILAFVILFFAQMASISEAADVRVRVTNIKNDEGTIRVALWKNPENFPSGDQNYSGQVVKANQNKASVVFSDLQPGTYAVSLYHDANANAELDTGWFGIPVEGVGFSNNAVSSFGPPSFQKAMFQVVDQDLELAISVVYINN